MIGRLKHISERLQRALHGERRKGVMRSLIMRTLRGLIALRYMSRPSRDFYFYNGFAQPQCRRVQHRRHMAGLLLTVVLSSSGLLALPPSKPMMSQYERRIYSFSLAGGFGYSFFKVDERHSEKASSLLGMTGMFRFHFFATPNVHIHLGLEVLSQKTKFNTYYFADGHSQFYDRSFGYTHRMRTYELYIPLMMRVGTNMQEANARSIFYFEGGYAIKTFLSASTLVTRNVDNEDIWGGTTELTFEHEFLSEQTNSVALIGIGLDKRIGWTEKFISFELLYRYGFSRFRYQGNFNTNDLMFKNSCLTFQIGYRFQ